MKSPDRVHLDFTNVQERANLWREFEINPDTEMTCLWHHEASARWRYEAWFPFENTPELAAERLQIGARVDWTKGAGRDAEGLLACVTVDAVSIVFKREGIWYAAGAWDWTPAFKEAGSKLFGNTSPENVFHRLRAHAATLAQWGITNLVWQAWHPGNEEIMEEWGGSLGFGNAPREALGEVLRTIQAISPTAVETTIRVGLRGLLETLDPRELEAIRKPLSTALKSLAPMDRSLYWVPGEDNPEEVFLDLSNEGCCNEPWGLDRALENLWAHMDPESWGQLREKLVALFGNTDLVRWMFQHRP